MVKKYLCLICIHFLSVSVFAQEKGSSFIQNFKPSKDYHGHSQNWTMLQGDNGLLYIGNNNGLIEYDGVSFTEILSPGVLRCLAFDQYGLLYAGFKSEFGYFRTDSVGRFKYVSLSQALPEEHKKFGNIWRVIIKGDDIYFNAFEAIFHYKNFHLQKVYKPETSFFIAFLIDNEIYVSELKKGLKKLANGEFKLVPNGEKLADDKVYNMTKYDENSILLGSRRMGFYLYKPQLNEFTKFSSEADSAILKGKYAVVLNSQDKYLLFSTTAGESGVVITDKQGKLVRYINKNTGLQDNIIFDIVPDQQQGIWLALNNGLSRIELNSPITNWNEINGLEGNKCYSVIRHKGKVYVGTAQGVYALEKDGLFKKLAGNATLHTWDFQVYKTPDNQELLLFCNQNGLWEIENNTTIFLGVVPNVYTILPMQNDPRYLFCGTREGVSILEYDKGKFVEKSKIKGLEGEVRNILYDAEGSLWVSVERKGIYKLNDFSITDFQPKRVQKFGTEQGIDLTNDMNLCLHNGKIMIANVKSIFQQTANGIEISPLNQLFINENKSFRELLSDNQGKLWIAGVKENDKILLGSIQAEGQFQDKLFRRLPSMEINKLYADFANIIWIATSEGLFRYDGSQAFEPTKNFTALIRKVTLENDSTLFHGHYAEFSKEGFKNMATQTSFFTPKLPYQFNSLIFHYAAPAFDAGSSSHEYSYLLEGFEKEWSAWVKDTKKEYTNLREGTYTFKVKAKNIYGDESSVATYQFMVLPPWYRTWWAYLLYTVASVVVIWAFVRYYAKKLKTENEQLENTIRERTAEIEQQREEIEKQRDALQEKNDDIIASINVAKRIQKAMLPTTASLQQILPQSFVFFQPRDIVSGDFYWVAEVRKTGRSYVVLAVADCTGHGVPGAFVSMVGANILNNLVVEQKMVEPNRILSLLDKEVRKALQQDKGEGRDGMDIALISLTHQLQSTSFSQLEYAGAMNPLYYVQGGEMKEIKATKLPIGGEFTGEKQFTNHTIVLDTPTVIYLCSDGFQDQFGGEQNKKFMTRKLRELLFSLHALPMHTQKENLKQVFIDWKGEYEQIDDVTVMGLAV